MGQEDYLKRQFDQLGRVLAKILSKLTGPDSGADASILFENVRDVIGREMGLDLKKLSSISGENLIDLIDGPEKVRMNNLAIFADILFELAEQIDGEIGDEVLIDALYSRSLFMNEYVHTRSPVYSLEREFRIATLQDRLSDK